MPRNEQHTSVAMHAGELKIAEMLVAAQRGERPAVEFLLRELQDPWYRLCLGLLRDSELAKDATQETALRFLRQLPTFRGESRLRTWALGIALNVVREMRRSRRLEQIPIDDELDRVVDDRMPYPDTYLENAEEQAALHETLAGLPDRQREAVVLRFFEDISTAEAAAVMRCAPGTVKATLHQALRRMRQKLMMFI